MKIKKVMNFLLASLFLLFASTSVALTQEVCSVDIKGSGTWHFELFSGPTLVDGGCALTSSYYPNGPSVSVDECYEYEYKITPPGTDGVSSVILTFPVNLAEEVLVGGANQVFKPAEGDDVLYLAEGVQELFTGRFPPVNDKWKVYSNIRKMSLGTVAVKSGKYVGSCGIDVPNPLGYDPTEKFTFNSKEEVTTSDGKKFKFTRDPDTNCVVTAEKCNAYDDTSGECNGWEDMKKVPLEEYLQTVGVDEIPPNQGIKFVGHQNQKCYEAWVNSNPWAIINGRWVRY